VAGVSRVAVRDLAPTRAPHVHPAAPCHYMSGDAAFPTRRRRDGRGSGARRNVVARGRVGGGWALVGARCGTVPNGSRSEPSHPAGRGSKIVSLIDRWP